MASNLFPLFSDKEKKAIKLARTAEQKQRGKALCKIVQSLLTMAEKKPTLVNPTLVSIRHLAQINEGAYLPQAMDAFQKAASLSYEAWNKEKNFGAIYAFSLFTNLIDSLNGVHSFVKKLPTTEQQVQTLEAVLPLASPRMQIKIGKSLSQYKFKLNGENSQVSFGTPWLHSLPPKNVTFGNKWSLDQNAPAVQ